MRGRQRKLLLPSHGRLRPAGRRHLKFLTASQSECGTVELFQVGGEVRGEGGGEWGTSLWTRNRQGQECIWFTGSSDSELIVMGGVSAAG